MGQCRGPAELLGPDDGVISAEALRQLLRAVFVAAGGTHDDWAEYDRVMLEQGAPSCLITADQDLQQLTSRPRADAVGVTERNVLGGELEPCGTDPMTGFFRDGCCNTGPDDVGSHTICAVVTAEFLDASAPHRQRPVDADAGLRLSRAWCRAIAGA